MALNDCEKVDSPGGTHWSLLVYRKLEDTFFSLGYFIGKYTYQVMARVISKK
jgi:hypothetical protein